MRSYQYQQKISITTLISSILFLLMSCPLSAQDINNQEINLDNKGKKVEAKDFDFNRNGLIDAGKEQEVYIKHVESEYYRVADLNKDGHIDENEKEKYEKALGDEIDLVAVDFDFIRDEGDTISIEDADEIVYKPKPQASPIGNLRIRREYEDVTVLQEIEKFSAVKGALFAYSSDLQNTNDILQARGAVFYTFKKFTELAPDREKTGLTGYSINPGISFDRVTNSNEDKKDKDVNILAFRLGSELEFSGGRFVDNQYLRNSIVYQTDFDFDTDVLAFEAQWEPKKLYWGIGVSRDILNSTFAYRLRTILHTETGSVIDSDDEESIGDGDFFLRIGPKVELNFWSKKFLKRLGLNIKYEYLAGLAGDSGSTDLFETGLTYRLDEVGYAVLELNYRNGEIALTKENIELFTLGFGVKF